MAERLLQLGRAHERTRAAGDGLALLALDVGTTDRALLRQLRNWRAGRPLFLDDLDDLGYDVAGPSQDDGVTDAHVLATQLLEVVQCRVGHRRATHEHGIESRHRRQRASPADLPFD